MFTEENNIYWKKFSELISADFTERKYWHSAKSIYNYKGFNIIFSHYTHNAVSDLSYAKSFVTRIRCIFKSKIFLNLKIEEINFLNKVLHIFNHKIIKLNNPKIDSKFIVTSNTQNISKLFSKSFCDKLIETNIKRLYIDSNDRIWGRKLDKNHYELATYFDFYKVEYDELLKIKELFKESIDHLLTTYNVQPITFNPQQ